MTLGATWFATVTFTVQMFQRHLEESQFPDFALAVEAA